MIAYRYPVGVGADGLDNPRSLVPDHQRQRGGGVRDADQQVGVTVADTDNADQDLLWPRVGQRHIFDLVTAGAIA